MKASKIKTSTEESEQNPDESIAQQSPEMIEKRSYKGPAVAFLVNRQNKGNGAAHSDAVKAAKQTENKSRVEHNFSRRFRL